MYCILHVFGAVGKLALLSNVISQFKSILQYYRHIINVSRTITLSLYVIDISIAMNDTFYDNGHDD